MWIVDRGMKFRFGVLVAVSVMLFTACEKGERPVLGELVVDSVAFDAIYCHVDVAEGAPDDYAFYYATTKGVVESNKATYVEGDYREGMLCAAIEGLKPNTVYYIRAYAMNSNGRTYTETISEKTQARFPEMDDNDFPAVDR